MSWLTRMFGIDAAEALEEVRSVTGSDVFGPSYEAAWEQTLDVAGDKALRLVPVYSATAMIADQLSATPTGFYRKVGGVRRPISDPAWWSAPDPAVDVFSWKYQALTSLLLRGNAYGQIVRDSKKPSSREILAIRWLNPSKVEVDESGVLPDYIIDKSRERHQHWRVGGDILHIPAYVVPGSCVGLSPVGLFQRQFEMSRNALVTADDWFEGRAVPSGILSTDRSLTAEQSATAKARARASFRSGEPLVMDKQWRWEQVTLPPSESGFLDAIKATANQIAAIYRVDPRDVGGTADNSLTYSTVEGNQRKLNNQTLLPWAVRVETAIGELLAADEVMKFNLDAMARPNTFERVRSTTEELNNGTLTLNEARAREDRPPLSDSEIEQWQAWFDTSKTKAIAPEGGKD